MSNIHSTQMTVELDDEVVLFLIGMRINKWWKIRKWFPVFWAMPKMLRELTSNPDLGLLHYRMHGLFVVQYWRSFDHLEAYARSKSHLHLPAWKAFNQKVGHAAGDVGLWHETYRIRPGEFEAVYSGMPPFGLGHIGRLKPLGRRSDSARARLNTKQEINHV